MWVARGPPARRGQSSWNPEIKMVDGASARASNGPPTGLLAENDMKREKAKGFDLFKENLVATMCASMVENVSS